MKNLGGAAFSPASRRALRAARCTAASSRVRRAASSAASSTAPMECCAGACCLRLGGAGRDRAGGLATPLERVDGPALLVSDALLDLGAALTPRELFFGRPRKNFFSPMVLACRRANLPGGGGAPVDQDGQTTVRGAAPKSLMGSGEGAGHAPWTLLPLHRSTAVRAAPVPRRCKAGAAESAGGAPVRSQRRTGWSAAAHGQRTGSGEGAGHAPWPREAPRPLSTALTALGQRQTGPQLGNPRGERKKYMRGEGCKI